jgi:flagellar hook-associated protein 1
VPSIYTMMDISRWALQASTRQLDTVSHNVANVDTEGYSRQEVVLSTRTPEWTTEGFYGHGVQTQSVIQHVDKFLQNRLTDKQSDVSYFDARLAQLKRLESLSNESSDNSLGSELTNFFNAWSDLANNPESTAVREAMRETANSLVNRFQTISQDMNLVSRDMDGYLANGVATVNSLCRQISDLNQKIVGSEQAGVSANDFRDQRTRLLGELAQKANVKWFEDGRGSVTVYFGNGKTLVQDNYPTPNDADPLSFQSVSGYTSNQIVWQGQNIVIDSGELTGGELGAWLKVRDEDIPAMKAYMDGLAKNLINQVNLVHSQGVGLTKFTDVTGSYKTNDPTIALNDNANTLPTKDLIGAGSFDVWAYVGGTRQKVSVNVAPTNSLVALRDNLNTGFAAAGVNLTASLTSDNRLEIANTDSATEFAFGNDTSGILAALGINTFFTGDTASSMALNDDIQADVRAIAAGRLLATGEHALGDNSNALLLADLKDKDTMTNASQTFNESLVAWSSSLGTNVSSAQSNRDYAETINNQLKNQRDATSAVNLDEEMVKMIQFQRAFQMASKLISTADTLLQTLLDLKR